MKYGGDDFSDMRDGIDMTALHHACAMSYYVTWWLLQSDAEIDMRDSSDMTALHHACAMSYYVT